MTLTSPGLAFTNQVPAIDAMMAKPPIVSG